MTDNVDLNNIPQATAEPKKRHRFSVVWIIPILAAVVALGIAVQRILSEGPTITIIFKTAEGVEEGKTYVKYKDVNIGQVKTVKLSGDFAKVVVTAKIDKSAEGLIVEDAKFWIEKPRVTLSGISGMGTLLSGNYIGFDVGKSKKPRRQFIGLEVPPAIKIDQPGRWFVLQADELGSVGIGSPVYYRRLNVGQVIGYNLSADGRSVEIKVFVDAPYDKYITSTTRFWQASGVDVSLGANGLNVQTQSVLSLLIGGIAFETPPFALEAEPAAGTVFALYSDRRAATAQHEAIIQPYVLYFNESLRGLSVGAPVTFLGLPVGEVTAIGLEYNPATDGLRPRVDVAIYPMRLGMFVKDKSNEIDKKIQSESERHAAAQKMVDRGVRAQLRSGSLLTGQLYVALDRFPDAPKANKIDWTKSPPELPVMPGGLQDLENKINGILAKINKMPLEAIGEDLKKLLATTDQMMKRVDTEITPELKTTLEDLKRVLENTNATLVGKDAPAQQDLRDALQEMTRAARAIRVFTDYLERHPEALIRGKTKEKP